MFIYIFIYVITFVWMVYCWVYHGLPHWADLGDFSVALLLHWQPLSHMRPSGRKDVNDFLVGGWATPLKHMSSSVGIMKFPIYGKTYGKLEKLFQTTNQFHGFWCESMSFHLHDVQWCAMHDHSLPTKLYSERIWMPPMSFRLSLLNGPIEGDKKLWVQQRKNKQEPLQTHFQW